MKTIEENESIDCVAQQYENLAEDWANHLDTPFGTDGRCLMLIEALWRNIYPEVIESIEIDPHAFADRVAMYRLFLQSGEPK